MEVGKVMLAIYSTEYEHATADSNIENWFEAIKERKTVYFSTFTMFTRLRVGVKRGEIKPFKVMFSSCNVNIDSDGNPDMWPEELDVCSKMLMELL